MGRDKSAKDIKQISKSPAGGCVPTNNYSVNHEEVNLGSILGIIGIIFVVLLVSLALNNGCAEAEPAFIAPLSPTITSSPAPAITASSTPVIPAFSTPSTSTVTESISLPSGTPQPSATAAVIPAVPLISVEDAFSLIQNNKDNPDFIIIDVRTADEFNNGHLANAINIDYYSSDFKLMVGQLDRQKEYLIYCRSGNRSASATQIMIDLGFTRIHNLSGGIVQWLNARYPTTQLVSSVTHW